MTAIVFDLDGTLIDSAPDIRAAVNLMLTEEGLPTLDLPTIVSFIGNGLPHLVMLTIQKTGLDMARHAELSQVVLANYSANSSTLTRLYPGVRDALDVLHNAGHRLGLCTNKPEAPARDILVHYDLNGLFDVVVGGDTLPVRKPDPAPLVAAFDALGCGGIYVGDSEVDAETSVRAKVPFALFTQGYRKTPVAEVPHTWSFEDFAALQGIVQSAPGRAAE